MRSNRKGKLRSDSSVSIIRKLESVGVVRVETKAGWCPERVPGRVDEQILSNSQTTV